MGSPHQKLEEWADLPPRVLIQLVGLVHAGGARGGPASWARPVRVAAATLSRLIAAELEKQRLMPAVPHRELAAGQLLPASDREEAAEAAGRA